MEATGLRAVLERVGCGVVVVGGDGGVVRVNARARAFVGLPPAGTVLDLRAYLVRLLGPGAQAAIEADGGEAAHLAKLALRGDEGLIAASADRRWYRLSVEADAGQGATVLSIVDVSDLKRRELLLAELHDRLAGEGQNLKRFAQDLALARSAAAEALRRQEQANVALEREIAERSQLETELRRLADTDPLTDSLNRRRFLEIVGQQITRARSAKSPATPGLTVLMLDIDHFKLINDRFGHDGGDRALVHFAEAVRGVLRAPAVLGRLGGEEFAVLLPNCPLDDGLRVAVRLKRAVALPFAVEGGDGPAVLSVSIGVAALADGEDAADPILKRADRALYRAKDAGRDMIAWERSDGSTGLVADNGPAAGVDQPP